MTVEKYLSSLVIGLNLPIEVLERAAYSPMEVGLAPFELSDEAYPKEGIDEEFQKRLDYASSTVYYSVLGVFAGGGYSEQVGDIRTSQGGFTITMADRTRFQSLADKLRTNWGFDVEGATDSGLFNAGYLRGAHLKPTTRTIQVPLGYEALLVKK